MSGAAGVGSALWVRTASEPDSVSEPDSSLRWPLWQAAVQLGRALRWKGSKSRSFRMKKEPPPYLWKMGADLGWEGLLGSLVSGLAASWGKAGSRGW